MPVRVIPVGFLRDRFSQGELVLDAAGQTVTEILTHLAVPPDLVGVVLVNGRQVSKDTALQDGDEVKLVPFVGGG